jgi:primosomal protein N'
MYITRTCSIFFEIGSNLVQWRISTALLLHKNGKTHPAALEKFQLHLLTWWQRIILSYRKKLLMLMAPILNRAKKKKKKERKKERKTERKKEKNPIHCASFTHSRNEHTVQSILCACLLEYILQNVEANENTLELTQFKALYIY